MQVTKGPDGRYYKSCPECGEEQSYLRACYARESLRLNKLCKKCSNRKTDNCHRGWYRGIRISWYNAFKVSAETRGKEWNITMDDVANGYDKQKGKCALTGLDIVFPETGQVHTMRCSIDRIDNSRGYEHDNIQLIDGRVNMMKGKYSQELFKDVCKAVAVQG